jgi:ubiquitin carboxyl-terminal hydrolase L5
MMSYETTNIEFSLLSVVKDASDDLQDELAANVKALSSVWTAFERAVGGSPPDSSLPDRADLPFLENAVWAAAPEYGLEEGTIEAAEVSETLALQIAHCIGRADFITFLDHVASSQSDIRRRIMEERNSRAGEDDLAARRRHDYAPAVFRWLQMLHEKGELESLLTEARST